MRDRQAQILSANQVMVGYRLALGPPARPLPPLWIGLLSRMDDQWIDLHALLTFAGPAPSENPG